MAIVLTKKKIQALQKQPDYDLVSEFAELIDEVGVLSKDAEKINAKIKKLQEELKPYNDAVKRLKAKIDELEGDPDEELVELGTVYKLEIGKKGTSRHIKDIKKVQELMGDDLFYQVCKVNLKDIDAYLTLPQREEVIEEERTSRSFKIVKRD